MREGGFWDHNTCNERRENRWIGASIVNIHGTPSPRHDTHRLLYY
jgi:hypothetical protein